MQLINKLKKISRVKIDTRIIKNRIGDPRSVISDSSFLKDNIKLEKFKNINSILNDAFKMALYFKKKWKKIHTFSLKIVSSKKLLKIKD